ncbi:MAG: histidine phosphatase family protein [Betaproteobacteria bacterium]|nr:histidine phosphatase family protein [Betaproteobacteria bacterium]
MSLELELLRHGDTGASGFRGRGDDALSPLGLAQMHEAVRRGADWEFVVCSPLRRCAVFAENLARARRLPLHVEARLAEIDFGAWEGKTNEALLESDREALLAFWQDPWRHPPTGGESLPDFARRVRAALADLLRLKPTGRGLVVTHGGVIRLCLAQARGLARSRLTEIAVAHGSRFGLRAELDARGALRLAEVIHGSFQNRRD